MAVVIYQNQVGKEITWIANTNLALANVTWNVKISNGATLSWSPILLTVANGKTTMKYITIPGDLVAVGRYVIYPRAYFDASNIFELSEFQFDVYPR